MVCCCVPYCKKRSGVEKGISFHEFPSNETLKNKWLIAIARKDFTPNTNSGSSVVCSEHFQATDFLQTFIRRRLMPGAVPSIFVGYPQYMKSNSLTKRKITKEETTSDKFASKSTSKQKTAKGRKGASDLVASNSMDINKTQVGTSDLVASTLPVKNSAIEWKTTRNLVSSTLPTKRKIDEVEISGLVVSNSHTKRKATESDLVSSNSPNKRQQINDELSSDVSKSPYIFTDPNLTETELFLSLERNATVAKLNSKIKRLQENLWKRNKALEKLQATHKETNEKLGALKKDKYFNNIQKISEDASWNNPNAQFLYDVINNYSRKKPQWSDATLRECVLFYHLLPQGYAHVREHIVNLPCKNTIKLYAKRILTSVDVDDESEPKSTEESEEQNDVDSRSELGDEESKIALSDNDMEHSLSDCDLEISLIEVNSRSGFSDGDL